MLRGIKIYFVLLLFKGENQFGFYHINEKRIKPLVLEYSARLEREKEIITKYLRRNMK